MDLGHSAHIHWHLSYKGKNAENKTYPQNRLQD